MLKRGKLLSINLTLLQLFLLVSFSFSISFILSQDNIVSAGKDLAVGLTPKQSKTIIEESVNEQFKV